MFNAESARQDLRKPSKAVKIVSIVASAILVLAILSAVITGLDLPHSKRIYSKDSGRITSVETLGGDEWFYTSSTGNVYRMNEHDHVEETLPLTELATSLGVDDCGELRSIYGEKGGRYLYVFSSGGYLFQLENGLELTVRGYTSLPSKMLLGITEKDGELYTINKVDAYCIVQKFHSDAMSAGATGKGYVYQGYSGANGIVLQFLKNVSVYSFEVVTEQGGDFLYILHSGGLIRMASDFAMNDWEDRLSEHLQARADEIYDALYRAELEKGTPEQNIRTSALKELAWETACEEFGVVDYKEDTGEVTLSRKDFKDSLYGYYRTEGVTYTGCAYIPDRNVYYVTANNDKLYMLDSAQLSSLSMGKPTLKCEEVSGITLAGHPRTEGKSLFYEEQLQVGYVVYQASNKLTRIDFSTMTVEFTSAVEFDIRDVIQSSDGGNIRFLYSNANEAGSGTLILRSLTIGGQNSEGVLKAFRAIAIVLAVVAGLTALVGYLCWFVPGQYEKTLAVGRGMKKHWKIFVVLAFSLTLLGMFCYYPAIGSIQLSFFDYTLEKPTKLWNGFAHYKTIFTSEDAAEEFGNMFFFLICDLFTALAPPLVFAFFLTIMRNKTYSTITRTLLFIPGVIPGVATTLIWKTGIYGEYGVLNAAIRMMNGEPIKFLAQTNIAKWSLVLMGFPYVGSYLIFYGAMMNVPDSYYEAAELDGITVIKRFVCIDIPLIFAQIKYVIIMTFIASVQNFGRVYMITGGDWGTKTPIFTMYKRVLEGNYGLASAYATVIFVFLFAATVLNFRMQRKENEVA